MKLNKRKKSVSADRLIDIIKIVTGSDPMENTRAENVVLARQIFFKIFRDVEKWTFADMASIFDRDHATARHGKEKLEDLMEFDNEVASKYARVLSIFQNSEVIDTDILQEELYGKIIETNELIKQQNTYLAEMKVEMTKLRADVSMVSERNREYIPIIDILIDRLPKGKIDAAKPKIRAILNGL